MRSLLLTATTTLKSNPRTAMVAAGTNTTSEPSTGTSPKMGTLRVGKLATLGSVLVREAMRGSNGFGGTGGGAGAAAGAGDETVSMYSAASASSSGDEKRVVASNLLLRKKTEVACCHTDDVGSF